MTCKDCVHYDVCADTICFECDSNCCDECGIYAYNDGKIVELNICEHFKDKTAIEYRTPKKAIEKPTRTFFADIRCPCCNNLIGRSQKFCKECGQALDWT